MKAGPIPPPCPCDVCDGTVRRNVALCQGNDQTLATCNTCGKLYVRFFARWEPASVSPQLHPLHPERAT